MPDTIWSQAHGIDNAGVDRPWQESWEYHPVLLESATTRVRLLHEAAARPGVGQPSDIERVRQLLVEDLAVPAAIDVATDAGGDAARLLISVLGLA